VRKPSAFPINDASLAKAERWSLTSRKEGANWMQGVIARLRAAEADALLKQQKIDGLKIYIRSLRGDPDKQTSIERK
jgi:hypothetical protein